MRILPITNTRIYSNSKQRPCQTQASFQAVKPKKIQSPEIFNMRDELAPVLFNKEKYNAVLKKYANIDINSRNCNGDTMLTKYIREGDGYATNLYVMEKRGEIQGIDWNVTDANGDNLLMLAIKKLSSTVGLLDALVELANAGKIDVNYVNRQKGYSLPEYVLADSSEYHLEYLLRLKNIDLTQTASNTGSSQELLKSLIARRVSDKLFWAIINHPSVDIEKCNGEELHRYIDDASENPSYRYKPDYNGRYALYGCEKLRYKERIDSAIKVNNAKKIAKYYLDNEILTLEQIIKHVDNTDDEQAINMSLNKQGETIAHFLAKSPVDSNDEQKLKDLIDKMRQSICYFWKEDVLGRSPLMLALENRNFIVAKAMLEKMLNSELRYEAKCSSKAAIKSCNTNHIPALWDLIADFEPNDRRKFGRLLIERINSKE